RLPDKIASYRRDPETMRLYRHGAVVGLGYIAAHKPRCIHKSLLGEEWGGLVFNLCPDCGQHLANSQVVSLRAVAIIRRKKELWKDKRRTPIRWTWQERDGFGELEVQNYAGEWTNVRFPRHTARKPIQLDGGIAPEIEQRRLEAAWAYVLSSPDFREYRAPYTKVQELRDAGFSIAQMARRLKVSERTVNYRLMDIPETREVPDLLAARLKANRGYAVNTWYPGVGRYRTPQGPVEPEEKRNFPPVQRNLVTFPAARNQYCPRWELPFPSPPKVIKPRQTPEPYIFSRAVGKHDTARAMWFFREKNRKDSASAQQLLPEEIPAPPGIDVDDVPWNKKTLYDRSAVTAEPCRAGKYLTAAEKLLDFGGRWWERMYRAGGNVTIEPLPAADFSSTIQSSSWRAS
ncbi:MAG: hypothetical protein ACM3WP_02415, partial [Acidobacteriota bacterium]